ncbi:MAG: hypothetical protein C0412_01410 [Flavobacterium sp.]|nr:hypothetical protein [Flavobacterium sp.]
MQIRIKLPLILAILFLPFIINAQLKKKSVTVPMIIDHNRMLVDAEFQRKDGTWRIARLWIDSGSPNFFISESLARDLGIDLTVSNEKQSSCITPLPTIRIGEMQLNFEGVSSKVSSGPFWLFSATHNDGNLPATLLKKYHIVFDYPKQQLTIAEPGFLKPRGIRSQAAINPQTGIIQIDAVIDGENFSFALDCGASYSFVSDEITERLAKKNTAWPRIKGAIGSANMWGWWPPDEQSMMVLRVPEIKWGQVLLNNVGIVGVPEFSAQGPALGEWYSQKTTYLVHGFLGPNAFKAFRIEIDYANSAVYFEKDSNVNFNDMDIIGLTLQPQPDNSFKVIGVTQKDGKPIIEGVEQGDVILQIDNFKTTGATMGSVVDALRGKPGEERTLIFERNGKQFKIKAKIYRQL